MRLSPLPPVLALAGAAFAQAGEPETATLKYKVVKNWSYVLPAERWTRAADIAIAHARGAAFETRQEGMSLKIDSRGDGRFDQTVKGQGGHAVLRAKRPDGSDLVYAVRVVRNGAHYEWASSGVMTGTIAGESITLIDQDNDGLFHEVGVDAIVVGRGKAASYLSSVVNLKGKLYRFRANPRGTQVEIAPYEGATGTLSVRKGFRAQGKLLAAVVQKDGDDVWFEVGNESSVEVPAGTYRFVAGLANKGNETAKLRQGKMPPMVVAAGETVRPQLGVPLMVEFGYTRDGDMVTVQPDVHFYGRGGEEWHTILPELKSPKLTFFDKETGRPLASKRFEQC